MDLTYFNPNSQKEADFLMGFVARQRTLDFFLNQLRLAPASGTARHYLIVAPRGFGKTSLLRRIAIGVRTDEQLNSNFIPLRFREEQHNVISLDVFWRNCLQSLAEAREDEGASPDEIAALDAAWDAHAPRQALTQDQQDGEPAWQVLHAHCERLQRRPLLLIDNLDSLLAGLSSHHQWGLRKHLQSDDGPVLIAAASRYPAATHDQAAAFYEFFRIQPLDKLNDQEVFSCLRNLAVHRGAAGRPVLTLLDKDPGRVAALNTMAGGNPRTLSVLYGVLESHKSADVLSQLNAMLDTFTGWYQARTEELPVQARAVFDALALNWDPMTAAALGLATGLDTPIISSQLTRLEKAGYVEPVALSKRGKGRSGYQVSERFFNIWYLMRNGPRRAKQSIFFLTKFLQSCFSPAERRSHAISILESGQSDPGYALALASSFRGGLLRQQLLEQAHIRLNDSGQEDEYKSIINELRNEGQRQLSAVARKLDNVKQLIHEYDDVLARFGSATEPDLRERVATALLSKGFTLEDFGHSEQAITVYDDILARFGAAAEPALRDRVATALVSKGATLRALGQPEQAIEAYDDVLARFGAATETALRDQVAIALVSKGYTLGILGQLEESIAVYDDVLVRFGAATEDAMRDRVAMALINKGVTLDDLGQLEQAIAVYDDVLGRFGAATEIAMRNRVAKALVSKGVALGILGQSELAISIYDDVLARIDLPTDSAQRELAVLALLNKGVALGDLGQSEQAIAVYDDLLARFGTTTEPALLDLVAMAFISKGAALGVLGQSEQAIEAYDDLLARLDLVTDPIQRELVAIALVNKGAMLGDFGRSEQAVAVYDDVLARYRAATEPALRKRVAKVFEGRAILLREGEHYDASESTYRDAIEWDSTVSRFHVGLGNLLLDYTGEISGALAAFQRGLETVANRTDRVLLHANLAYAIALHDGDRLVARMHAKSALENETEVSPAGRRLLEALPIWSDRADPDWSSVFEHVGKALNSDDPTLWTNYSDDMQRILWYVLANGQGDNFKHWMADAQFQNRYAPLYHAFVAALEGDDHLLRINPETRQPAQAIYAGIVRRLILWPVQKRAEKTSLRRQEADLADHR